MKRHIALLGTALLMGCLPVVAFAGEPLPQVDEREVDLFLADVSGMASFDPDFDPVREREKLKEVLGMMEVMRGEMRRIKDSTTDPEKKLRLDLVDHQMAPELLRQYVMATADVSEREIYETYRSMNNQFKIQQAAFPSEEEAREALGLLRKGMVMTDLVASRSGEAGERDLNVDGSEFRPITEIELEIAEIVPGLDPGQIAPEPVEVDDQWVIVKLLDVKPIEDDIPDLQSVKAQVRQIVAAKKATLHVDRLFERYDIDN